jgi:hypothetical protein
MVQRTLNAFGIAIGGLVLSLFVSSLPFTILVWLVAGPAVLYVASKGYDCALDSRDGRVVAITDRFAIDPAQRRFADRPHVLVSIRDRQFRVPTALMDTMSVTAMTLYFTPRSHILLNAEPAGPEP